MKIFRFSMMLCALALCSACGSSNVEEGASVGGVSGLATGAIVGDKVGHTGAGAVIGASTGVLTGAAVAAVVEQGEDHADKIAIQEEIIRRQKEEMRRQDIEAQDLKRQQRYYLRLCLLWYYRER